MPFETPSRPKPWTSPARRSAPTVRRVESELGPGRGGQVGDGAGVAERVRRLEVDEVGDRQQTPSRTRRRTGARSAPARRRSPPSRSRSRRGRRRCRPPRTRGTPTSAGSNWVPDRALGPAPWPRRRPAPGGPPRCTRPARRVGRRWGCRRPPASRANPCRPTARRRTPRAVHTVSANPSSMASFCRQLGVPVDHAVHVVTSVQRELHAGAHPLRGGCPAPMRRTMATSSRKLLVCSYSNFVAFRSMSSPNHFACS